MSGAKGFDLSGLDLPALQHLALVLPPLIALREVVETKGGSVRVTLTGSDDIALTPHPDMPTRMKGHEGSNPLDVPVVPETVAPMQTPPQGAAATDDPVLAGVAAPADAGHPLPAASSPDAVKPAPAVDSSPAAGDPGPVDRLSAYLGGVARRGPWTMDSDAALMRLVCKGWKVGEIAADMGIDGGAVRDRIKVLTEAGKWRKEAVLDRLQRLVQA
jgi:hypothetical protein